MPHQPPGALNGSIPDAELEALFAPAWAAGASAGAVLAVSGGPDSTAMMHLFARWLALKGVETAGFWVATVDHGLRPASAEEAETVMRQAHDLGFQAAKLRWNGPKPAKGLAEAARQARYRLLSDLARQRGLRVLFTAHTADDQAETLLMRLARGSGVDGLAGMAPLRLMEDTGMHEADTPISLARPLLQVEKARLERYLHDAGISSHRDPTNMDTAYERPRVREARQALDALGLTPAALGLSARRLQRGQTALETMARAFYGEAGHAAARAHISPLGFVALERDALLAQPDDVALRILRLAIEAAGGAPAPVSLSGLEALLDAVRSRPDAAGTLAQAALRVRGDRILVEREPGRVPLPRFDIVPGMSRLWDGRFRIAVSVAEAGLYLGPLGAEGLACIEAAGLRNGTAPARTLHALPAVWRGADLVAVPSLGFTASASLQLSVDVVFRGLSLDRTARPVEI